MKLDKMDEPIKRENWSPSVFYVERLIKCSIEHAWLCLLDYEAWNPSFVDAQVVPVHGTPRTEGEVVLIKKTVPRPDGKPRPEFYAETVKIVPHRRIVWYIYPKEGNVFRNFVDLAVTEAASGVRLDSYYYSQHPLTGEALRAERMWIEEALHTNAQAFKRYCERSANR